jgi:SAM-dependent methyltransferase
MKSQHIPSDLCSRYERVSFRVENVIEKDTFDATYDVILCLSVTKWIHLNWGDEAIRKLFRKVHRALTAGGLFILEAQPWESYRNKRKMTETTRRMYREIKLFPEQFPKVLTEEIGFVCVERIVPRHPSKGFTRPIEIYRKIEPNEVKDVAEYNIVTQGVQRLENSGRFELSQQSPPSQSQSQQTQLQSQQTHTIVQSQAPSHNHNENSLRNDNSSVIGNINAAYA